MLNSSSISSEAKGEAVKKTHKRLTIKYIVAFSSTVETTAWEIVFWFL